MMNKLKIFILTHGQLGRSLKKIMEHMFGNELLKNVCSIPLTMNMKREDYYKNVKEKVGDEDFIMFTDINGGTPDIVAKMIIVEMKKGICISGVNLPMLMNIMRENEFGNLNTFIDKLIASGKDGIQKFYNKNR